MTKEHTLEELYQGVKVGEGRYLCAMRPEPPLKILTSMVEGIHAFPGMNFLKRRDNAEQLDKAQYHILDSGYWGVYGSLGEYLCAEVQLKESQPCVLEGIVDLNNVNV